MSSPPSLHVSLIALPEASVSVLYGLYDLLNAFRTMNGILDSATNYPPFEVEIVGEQAGEQRLAGDTLTHVHSSIATVPATDIIIVPALVMEKWQTGRYPALVTWLKQRYDDGAILCSACSGIFLLAETGLFDGRQSTIHWVYSRHFQKVFPKIPLSPEKTLVVAGDREQFVSCGASMSWHDLGLYLIARHVNPAAAQAVARFFALQWHRDGLAPFIAFEGRRDHGDAAVLTAQTWLATHYSVADPVEQMVRQSGLATRTFKRRFTNATGHAPLDYVQRLRIEEAKRRLERTGESVDEIGWQVGYEEPAFFRRLFKRVTGLSPSSYRRQFQVPDYSARDTGPKPD